MSKKKKKPNKKPNNKKKKVKPGDIPTPSSWDSRSIDRLRREGHTFEAVERSLANLSHARLFIVTRGLITILKDEVAPHPEILGHNEQDIQFVADRLTACLCVIEQRLTAADDPAKQQPPDS